jgi:hypothetical protein
MIVEISMIVVMHGAMTDVMNLMTTVSVAKDVAVECVAPHLGST